MYGNPFKQLTKLVEDENIDLVVMGTHGRSGLAHAFLGSLTEKMIRHAKCPVFSVRSKEKGDPREKYEGKHGGRAVKGQGVSGYMSSEVMDF